MNEFHTFVVHHSGGPRHQTVASILDYHTRPKSQGGRGYRDIGYNWIIDGNARLHIGRRIPTQGAHAPPNHGRLGCLVIGNNLSPRSAWTNGQIAELRKLWGAVHYVMPWLALKGHDEVMPPGYTECPGLDIHALLGA